MIKRSLNVENIKDLDKSDSFLYGDEGVISPDSKLIHKTNQPYSPIGSENNPELLAIQQQIFNSMEPHGLASAKEYQNVNKEPMVGSLCDMKPSSFNKEMLDNMLYADVFFTKLEYERLKLKNRTKNENQVEDMTDHKFDSESCLKALKDNGGYLICSGSDICKLDDLNKKGIKRKLDKELEIKDRMMRLISPFSCNSDKKPERKRNLLKTTTNREDLVDLGGSEYVEDLDARYFRNIKKARIACEKAVTSITHIANTIVAETKLHLKALDEKVDKEYQVFSETLEELFMDLDQDFPDKRPRMFNFFIQEAQELLKMVKGEEAR